MNVIEELVRSDFNMDNVQNSLVNYSPEATNLR